MDFTFKNNSIKNSIILFFLIFTSLYSISFLIDDIYVKSFRYLGQTYFDSNINNDNAIQKYIKLITLPNKPTIIEVKITYYQKKDADGNFIVKTIGSDLRLEALIGTILFTSLIFSFPIEFKKNLLKFLIGIVILYAFIFVKLYLFVFDNYNYPEYAIQELPALTSFVVYWGSYFFNVTGTSTNVILPVLLWLSLNIKFLISNINSSLTT